LGLRTFAKRGVIGGLNYDLEEKTTRRGMMNIYRPIRTRNTYATRIASQRMANKVKRGNISTINPSKRLKELKMVYKNNGWTTQKKIKKAGHNINTTVNRYGQEQKTKKKTIIFTSYKHNK